MSAIKYPIGFDLERYRRNIADYERSWRPTDLQLRRLCEEHPGHEDPGSVNAKLLIIGRSFATGIERKVKATGNQGGALSIISRHLIQNAAEVDRLINSIPTEAEYLEDSRIEPVLQAHGEFVTLLRKITRKGQPPRSFVSKYLHFHRPVVPLYDSYAQNVIPKLVRWSAALKVVEYRKPFDEVYWEYLMRFRRLLQLAADQGVRPTSREMDYHIICESEHPWTSR